MGQYTYRDSQDEDVDDINISIVVSLYNESITSALLDGALNEFDRRGVTRENIDIYYVPGSLELAVVAKACSAYCDAVVCLGAIVRGDTAHFDYVSQGTTLAIANVAIETGVPCIFGVLTVDSIEQAKERIGGAHGNKGEESAATALDTIRTLRDVRSKKKSSKNSSTGFVTL